MSNVTLKDIAFHNFDHGYLSHYSALEKFGFVNASKRSVYLTCDFKFYREKGFRIFVDNKTIFKMVCIKEKSKNSEIGIIRKPEISRYPFTDLERTLIDCIVYPQFSGGLLIVQEVFEKAKYFIDIKKIIQYVDVMNIDFPIYQLIGYLLTRSGGNIKNIHFLEKKISLFDYYVKYCSNEREYCPKWKVYYPKFNF
ncbi:hypothetical protein GCM10009430_32130 [Aquimarina litoralis]|uniref:Uncharacterized protein n=2 Tax=Aquimarina litoralis TaxID=584605 RepID=A0ABN1J1X0_9FLAO